MMFWRIRNQMDRPAGEVLGCRTGREIKCAYFRFVKQLRAFYNVLKKNDLGGMSVEAVPATYSGLERIRLDRSHGACLETFLSSQVCRYATPPNRLGFGADDSRVTR